MRTTIAASFGVPLDEYHALLQDAASARAASLEELNEDEHTGFDGRADDEPYSALYDTAFMQELAGDRAPAEREKLAARSTTTTSSTCARSARSWAPPSRACQIHADARAPALTRLTGRLRAERNERRSRRSSPTPPVQPVRQEERRQER
jgi:hypothetical protein